MAVNQRLGQQRVLSVYNFMTSRITANAAAASVISGSAAETLSSVETDIEDYRSLCIMMRRANDPDYLTVKALCDLHLPNQDYAQLKEKLQKNDGGRLWQRLLQQYFPQLRSARFVIYLQRVPKPEEPKPEEPISPISPMSPTSPISPTSPTSPTPQSQSTTPYPAASSSQLRPTCCSTWLTCLAITAGAPYPTWPLSTIH